jgi:16S rRNA (cytidine1402-2'-O)-methyltransferase
MDRAGSLTVVAGPIGNLSDMTDRVREALTESEFWIVEDTRVSSRLAMALGIKKPMKVLNDHTSPVRVQQLVAEISAAQGVALLSDAGTPGVSDPGADLVDRCYEEGIAVDGAPGPSAVTCALMLSGFFAQRFAFLGFLGRKPGAMREVLEPFSESTLTLVFFESPNRIEKLLEACASALGTRRYTICRELTKSHQQVWRGLLPSLPTEQEVPRRGEFTLVIEGLRRTRT